ncbi:MULTISPECIES: glycoside hydrolase 100 family protein [unclassified Actinotalea]|uniref:glucosylglycerate hydrolase n=1 Tax=unclassified Actinotalea TaxID=2638618 RepID=UPI0015F5A23A|nr:MULTISPECIES: glycoside hydrolase 100 family protein [unclassified Actinotalea]
MISNAADRLAQAAADVLRRNDRGTRTVAAPDLYPHQWSWDAAFVAMGWARISVPRALRELDGLLAGQWATGMIPHIVFSDEDGYFPGPERWRTERATAAPSAVRTSGICQPGVHSLALAVIGSQARANGGEDAELFRDFLGRTFDAWFAWHRWLGDVRSANPVGLVEIHHGWESGMDNSPRWDEAYRRVSVGALEPYVRQDLRHVSDAGERPSDRDYDRYVWLLDQLASVAYDDAAARDVVDFRVGDVFFTALHALSSELLAGLGDGIARHDQAAELRAMSRRAGDAVAATVSPTTGLARDADLRAGGWLHAETVGGFAPLVCGAPAPLHDDLVALLMGERWCGHPDLHRPLPPTTSPGSPAFVSHNYWRGPQWPVLTWLMSWSLAHHGHHDEAGALREAGLGQLADLRFAEYYDALDGRPLGSMAQSWTAAVALAWQDRPGGWWA